MNLNESLDLLESLKNNKGILSFEDFDELFEIIPVNGDGNCLFYSIEILNSKFTYSQLRDKVCDYYKMFRPSFRYKVDSLKYQLSFLMKYDNKENDGTFHRENICKDHEWASVMDIIAIALILENNIILMNKNLDGYSIQPYILGPKFKTIFIKYNGINHFEALLPKFAVESPRKRSRLSGGTIKMKNKKIMTKKRKTIKNKKNSN